MNYREHFAGLSRDMLFGKAVYFAEYSDMLEEKSRKLREVIKELEQSNKVLTSKVNGAEEVIEGLEKELAQTRAELDNRVRNLREQVEAKNGLIGTLRAQLKQAAEFGDICMDKIRDLEMKNGKLNEDTKNYERKIDLQNEYIHELEEHIVDLETKRDDFMHAYEHAREVIENQKATIQHIDECRDELETKRTESDGIRKAVSEENDKLHRRTWVLQRENLILEYEIKNLKETKLGVINSFNLDCEGVYIELMLTHEAGKSFMRNVKVFKEGTAIKVSDFVKAEKPVTPKNLWTAGETVTEGFAAGVKAKEPEEPVCKSVPCSTVIGKLENCWINSEGVRIQVRLSKEADERFKAVRSHIIGEEIDIRDLMMPDTLRREMDEFAARFHKEVAKACEIPEHVFTSYLQKPRVKDYDCIAKHIKNKYDALRKVGFTDDQAMTFLPLWDDEDYV